MNIFQEARDYTECMAESVAECEVFCGESLDQSVLPKDTVETSIRTTWPLLIDDCENGVASFKQTYVAELHQRLTSAVQQPIEDVFQDRADVPWESYYQQGCGDEPRCEDGWVVCELYWGGYVKHFRLTLGWFVMNAMRMTNGLNVIHPDSDNFDDFVYNLRGSGPPVYDAEGFRGLFYKLERDQTV